MKTKSQRSVDDIQKEIDQEKAKLETIQGSQCERYSRIVGYYRPKTLWNPGRAEEDKLRKSFSTYGNQRINQEKAV